MDKELLLKDGLLYFTFAAVAAGSPLLVTDKVVVGVVLYGMALVALAYRTYLKHLEGKKK